MLVILASGIVIYIKLSAGGPIIQMVNPAGIYNVDLCIEILAHFFTYKYSQNSTFLFKEITSYDTFFTKNICQKSTFFQKIIKISANVAHFFLNVDQH